MIHVVTPIRKADPLVMLLLRTLLGPSLDAQHEHFHWTIVLPAKCRKAFRDQVDRFAGDAGAVVTDQRPHIEPGLAVLVRPTWAVGRNMLTTYLDIASKLGARSAAVAFEHGIDYHLASGLVRQVFERSGVCSAGVGKSAASIDEAQAEDMLFVQSSEPMWLRCVNGPEPPWEQAMDVQKYFGCEICGPLAGSR